MSAEARPLRALFVCTQNKLRSPTAETLFRERPRAFVRITPLEERHLQRLHSPERSPYFTHSARSKRRSLFDKCSKWQVASAGTARDAEVPLTRDLLEWADVAVCMEKRHRDWIRSKLRGIMTDDRILTLGIPDEYAYMDPELMALLGRLVPARLAGTSPR